MSRLDNFRGLSNHTWYRKQFRRLSLTDLATCERFIADHAALATQEYCSAVLRWGVDVKIESKNYPVMNELLLVAGTMEQNNNRGRSPEQRSKK